MLSKRNKVKPSMSGENSCYLGALGSVSWSGEDSRTSSRSMDMSISFASRYATRSSSGSNSYRWSCAHDKFPE